MAIESYTPIASGVAAFDAEIPECVIVATSDHWARAQGLLRKANRVPASSNRGAAPTKPRMQRADAVDRAPMPLVRRHWLREGGTPARQAMIALVKRRDAIIAWASRSWGRARLPGADALPALRTRPASSLYVS